MHDTSVNSPRARAFAGVVTSSARVVATLLALAGCSMHRPAASPASPSAARVELAPEAERNAQHALFNADLHRGDSLAKDDAGALASLFTDEVLYLYPGIPLVEGREAARQVLRDAGDGARVIRWQPIRAEVSRSGDFGYTIGYALRAAREGAAPVRLDRYQAVWVLRDGRWRIDAYSENPAGPLPTVTRPAGEHRTFVATDAAGSQAADADRAFAADAQRIGTGEAFAAWAAPDAVLGGGAGELAIGPVAIRRTFGPQPKGASLEWRPVAGRGAASGDLAFTTGEAVSTAPAPDGRLVSRNTKYLTVWRATAGGMRWVTDGGNAR